MGVITQQHILSGFGQFCDDRSLQSQWDGHTFDALKTEEN